jgi:hypothetical protein
VGREGQEEGEQEEEEESDIGAKPLSALALSNREEALAVSRAPAAEVTCLGLT